MSTTRTFQDMLNEYLTNDLLKEELVKRDYFLTKVEKDDGWKGGTVPVPFKGAGASSVAFGALTDSTDIAEDQYVRGTISSMKEVWGTMKFNHRDLMEHDGKIKETTFLRILPDAVDEFADYMKQVVSVNLLNGPHYAKATGNGAVGGTIVVDHPDRFMIGQKVIVDDDNSVEASGYVTAIDMNTKELTIKDARSGGAAVDLSAYTTAQNAKLYNPGQQPSAGYGFSSARDMLLSAANGGSSTLHGQTKLAYPFLQAINVNGSSVLSTNILSKIFDAYVTIRTFGKGNPAEAIMSYRNFGYVLANLESSKGAFNVIAGSEKTSVYGWTEIMIGGVKGMLKVIGVQEMDDDVIMFIDWRAFKFISNGFFKKRIAPDGKHYFEQRATTGYSYIIDQCLFGELMCIRPSYCGIMHSIP